MARLAKGVGGERGGIPHLDRGDGLACHGDAGSARHDEVMVAMVAQEGNDKEKRMAQGGTWLRG